jgi:hypothetical protein
MGLIVATKAFFKLLANRELSDSFQKLLDGELLPKIVQSSPPPTEKTSSSQSNQSQGQPVRSDAISLLAALQRESRLLDIVNEPLEDYSDAQVGAASRDVLKSSGKVIERMFGLIPLTSAAEGSQIETPAEFDAAEYRLTGNVSGTAPFRGSVAHHGWKATRCDVPKWTGNSSSAMVVAPIELEI